MAQRQIAPLLGPVLLYSIAQAFMTDTIVSCCMLSWSQGEPWSHWLQRVDRSMNIDIYLYVAGGSNGKADGSKAASAA